MSDQELQELARRWRESGRVEDEAAWLRARVRAGQLAPDRLAMAAFMGHEAAWLAMEVSPALVETLIDCARWVAEEVRLALVSKGAAVATRMAGVLAAIDSFRQCPLRAEP